MKNHLTAPSYFYHLDNSTPLTLPSSILRSSAFPKIILGSKVNKSHRLIDKFKILDDMQYTNFSSRIIKIGVVLLFILGLAGPPIQAQTLEGQNSEKIGGMTSLVLGVGNNISGGLPGLGIILDKGISDLAAFGIYAGYDQYDNLFSVDHRITLGARVTGFVIPIVSKFLDEDIELNGLQPYVGIASGYSFFTSSLTDDFIGDFGSFRSGIVLGSRYYFSSRIAVMGEYGLSVIVLNQLTVGLTFGGN